jgi:hypothetical protein
MLGLLVASFMIMATTARDLELLERVPSLAPLFPIAPSLRVWQKLVDIDRAMLSARTDVGERLSRELLDALNAHETHGLLPFYAQMARHKQMLLQAVAAASRGSAETMTWSSELEQVVGFRASAWRARMLYELMNGNTDAANLCRRRAELLNVQDAGSAILPGVTAVAESAAYLYTHNVVGLKRVVERLEVMARRFERWRPSHAIAHSHYLRLRGQYAGALETLRPALSLAPGRHPDYGHAAVAHVSLIHLLGDATAAVARGLDDLERCATAALPSAQCELLRVVGDAMTSAGRLADAEAMLDEHLRRVVARGVQGLMLGLAYEIRCRVAIAARDEGAVRQYAALSAEQYKGARNPLLSAQYRSLVREAELAGIDLTTAVQQAADATTGTQMAAATAAWTELGTIDSRLLLCRDTAERGRQGLELILQLTGAVGGFLFANEGHALRLLAAVAEPGPPSHALTESIEDVLGRELEADDEQTNYMSSTTDSPSTQTSGGIQSHECVVLVTRRANRAVTVGIAALRYASEPRGVIRRDVLDALVETLATHGVFAAPAPE